MENPSPQLKIIYCGTPVFAITPLKSLLDDSRFRVCFVITQKDKPAGRGKIMTPPPLKSFALKNKLIVQQPAEIKDLIQEISHVKPDFLVVFAYGQIIPPELLKIPKYGCINIHLSLLPKYRGSSPVQEALLQDDKETGITFISMDETLDTGDIISQQKHLINENDNTQTLLEKLSLLAAKLLPQTLIDFASGKLKPKPQKHKEAAYCRKIKKEDGLIDFKKETAKEILRKIKAFTPWPGCFFFADNKRIKIIQAEISEQKISSGKFALQTQKGFLIPLRVQLEGKKETSIEDFIRGNKNLLPS